MPYILIIIYEYTNDYTRCVNMFTNVDPRYFVWNNDTFIIMNGTGFERRKQYILKDMEGNEIARNKVFRPYRRHMYLYNIEKDHFVKLYTNNFDLTKIKIQKNWIPYIYKNELYFIYR